MTGCFVGIVLDRKSCDEHFSCLVFNFVRWWTSAYALACEKLMHDRVGSYYPQFANVFLEVW